MRFSSRFCSRLIALGAVVMLGACGDRYAMLSEPSARFAAQPGGELNAPGFFWMTPTVAATPTFSGTFDATRKPTVRIVCTGAVTPNCPTVAQLDANTPGAGAVLVDAVNQVYKTSWLAPSTLTTGAGKYRIEVVDGAQRLGQADLQVVITAREASAVPASNIAVIRGKSLAIRFRLETSAPASQLPGLPGDPAVSAITLAASPKTGQNFATGRADLPGLPTSVNDAIVHVKIDATIAQINAALRVVEGTIVGGVPGIPGKVPGTLILRFNTTTHAGMDARLALLRAQPGILDAAADVKLDATAVSKSNGGDPATWEWFAGSEGNWGMVKMRVPQLWNLNEWVAHNGLPTETGIIDAGFFRHDDLVLFDDLSQGVTDDHGTHVAGTIGAKYNNGIGVDGVNPFARLRAETFFGGMSSITTSLPLHITRYQNEPVVNISLGYNWYLHKPAIDASTSAPAQARASFDGLSLSYALGAIEGLGFELPEIVVAAGNDSRHNGTGEQPAKWLSPMTNASLEQGVAAIIVVEAVDATRARTSFTGVGGHIAAPGQAILSTIDGNTYGLKNGTSMAAPHVSGLLSYLYSMDPTLPRPTSTANVLRDLLVRNGIAAKDSPVPIADAFATAMDLDRLHGNDVLLRALLDIDDGSADGNLRVNAFGQPVTSLDLDGNGRLGDGVIDMSDFRRFRDHVIQSEKEFGLFQSGPVFLDGAADHPKKDLNGDGKVGIELAFGRADFNGNGLLFQSESKKMSGALDGQDLSDLQVLQSRFNDPNYTPAELINLISSADAIFNLTACFARSGVASMKIIAHEHGSTAITHQRLVPANQQVQIVTVPHSSTGADFDVIMLAPDGSEVARTNEFAPAELGQDTFITPACNTQVSVSPSNGPNVPTSGTQQFTAAVTGNGNTAVTWTATGGSINSSGLYTAGGAPGIYSVTATSVADPTQKATVTVNVTSTVAPPPARITFQAISPEAATVKFRARLVSFPFHTVQFTVDARSDGSGFLYPRGPLPPGVITSNVLPPSNLDPFTEDWIVEVTVPTRFLQPAVEGVTLEVKACYFKPDGGPMLGADRLPLCSILQLFY